jgi:hypothetical protein
MNGQKCSKCSAERAAGGTDACQCTQQAATTAHRAEPSETATPEDFQSLGARPYIYVKLPQPPGTQELPSNPPPGQSPAAPGQHATPSVPATPPSATVPSGMNVVDGRTPQAPHSLLEPSAPPTTGPNRPLSPSRPPSRKSSRRRQRRRPKGRRRQALILAAIAAAAAGYTSGLFTPDEPSRDTALQDGRTNAPEESGRGPASASASTEPSATKHARPSASTSATPAAPNRVPTARTGGSVSSAQVRTSQTVTVLRRGDNGPQVVELQQRLRQLSRSTPTTSPATSTYTRYITGDFNIPVENSHRAARSGRPQAR